MYLSDTSVVIQLMAFDDPIVWVMILSISILILIGFFVVATTKLLRRKPHKETH